MRAIQLTSLSAVAGRLREELTKKKFALVYAHNGVGKTRLSTEFKNIGKMVDGDGKTVKRDTLYFNAFTEDLFNWDNDLEYDRERRLNLNSDSSFFAGLRSLAMEEKIEEKLKHYADFSFYINYDEWYVIFFRERDRENNPIPIKVSRGEENIFIWCFFLAIVQIVIDEYKEGKEGKVGEEYSYGWVKYVYIDDPISSLDEHNAIKVAHDLTDLLDSSGKGLTAIISTHHVLFYNVVANQLRKRASKWFLAQGVDPGSYLLETCGEVPPFHHLSALVELSKVRGTDQLDVHHFNMLRRVLEQTAAFFGYDRWEECLKPKEGESEKAFQKRLLDFNSHGDCLIFQSSKIDAKMRSQFSVIFEEFCTQFPFKGSLFDKGAQETFMT